MPRSMTGFARQEVQHPWGTLSCEIRSVNHRYLEPSLRMPDTLRAAEPGLRETLRKRLSRGKVDVNIYLKTDSAQGADLALNNELAQAISAMAEQIQQHLPNPAKLNAMDILQWPGVLTSADIDRDTLLQTTQKLFADTLEQLLEARAREGAELQKLIEQRLDGIADYVAQVRERLPEILALNEQKLRDKLDALRVEVDQERLQQELVYLAQKADVAEELDRLHTHLGEVRNTLGQHGPIGRRLDFLMQELNREANTLSSKSVAADTTLAAVDVKVLIEQMREQIQNIE